MARHYKQSRADRMDESLGERRGRESSKKQSYASRRHESEGARHSMSMPRDHARGSRKEDTQMYHEGRGYYGEGHGEFANMPQREEMRRYPDPYSNLVESDYPDTLREIDRDMHDNMRNVERQRSDSMY